MKCYGKKILNGKKIIQTVIVYNFSFHKKYLKAILCALLLAPVMYSAMANASNELESIAANINNIKNGNSTSDFSLPRPDLPLGSVFSSDSGPLTSSPIIGGTNAARGEYQEYTLVILTDGFGNITSLCGGSLISANTVLTAAHCAQNAAATYFTIPGFYSFSDEVLGSDLIQASRVTAHPQYNATTIDNDIAVITLSSFSANPVAIVYEGGNDLVGVDGTVIGTGLSATRPTEIAPDILQEVDAPITSNQACNDAWNRLGGIRPITSNMLCAGFTTDARGTCSGDSGGPIYADFNGRRAIVGTVSFGIGECELNRGTQAYARTSALSDFIESASPNTVFISSNNTGFLPAMMMLLDDG